MNPLYEYIVYLVHKDIKSFVENIKWKWYYRTESEEEIN